MKKSMLWIGFPCLYIVLDFCKCSCIPISMSTSAFVSYLGFIAGYYASALQLKRVTCMRGSAVERLNEVFLT